MSEFKRNKGESFEAFLRRFNKTLLRSRKLNEVRSRKYHKDKQNKAEKKTQALHSKKVKEKLEYMKKIGKVKEETKGRW